MAVHGYFSPCRASSRRGKNTLGTGSASSTCGGLKQICQFCFTSEGRLAAIPGQERSIARPEVQKFVAPRRSEWIPSACLSRRCGEGRPSFHEDPWPEWNEGPNTALSLGYGSRSLHPPHLWPSRGRLNEVSDLISLPSLYENAPFSVPREFQAVLG